MSNNLQSTETPPEAPQHCHDGGCCKALAKRLDLGPVGFQAEQSFVDDPDAQQLEFKFAGVSFHSSRKDRGVMLNWCPFCGGQPGRFKRPDPPDASRGNLMAVIEQLVQAWPTPVMPGEVRAFDAARQMLDAGLPSDGAAR